MIPPSTFDFFLSLPLSVKVKTCLEALVAAYQVGVEEGSVYLGVVTFPWFMMKHTGALMKEQSVKIERALHAQPHCPWHLMASDDRSWELLSWPHGLLVLINTPPPSHSWTVLDRALICGASSWGPAQFPFEPFLIPTIEREV